MNFHHKLSQSALMITFSREIIAQQLIKQGETSLIKAFHLKEKPFKCFDCGYCSSKKSDLTSHIKAVHLKEKLFKCSDIQQMIFEITYQRCSFERNVI